ncbi:hypothetical protein [Stigmatella aurantiaca]|uniref:Uncharacterized protein n=2 Tax=Stigmatella aurantiaca TaxID=41 RepID=Q08MJ7_STIAD|nr:hypothetical protein [Stigmatella aurantiaca]ADO68836.1 uncharacterized protein STAUR_1032 [Stigmatella aurantiaca DW4/3-1]EAU61708.1 hypothetical protein STIAU_0166 [Stigmatella aurantiaca DW4/3-1]
MNPDGYTYLQLINATNQNLTQGSAGPGKFNQYQMASWFGFPNAPDPICGPASRLTYKLQFLEGVGDQDDAADLQLNIGDSTNQANAIVWIQARSTSQSGHYLTYQFQNPQSSLYIYGKSVNGGWDQINASQVQWGVIHNDALGQDFVKNVTNSLALVDLNQLFPDPNTANQYFAAVSQGLQPQSPQATTLFNQVSAYIKLTAQ